MIVYIAGPLSAKDGVSVETNVAAAFEVFFRLIKRGINAFCPHLVALHPKAWEIDYERWLEYDLVMLERCTHVLMLPRYETSQGAVFERNYAMSQNKIIVYDEESL